MDISEFVNIVLLPFGGISIVLIALATFLGNVNTKRIINGDLAQHKLKFESFKSDNDLKFQSIKDVHAKEIELIKLEHEKSMEHLRSEFKTEFLKHETYTSISKEKYQELFEKRIGIYEGFLNLKKEIDDSIVESAEFLHIHDDDPTHFTNSISKINEISQANPMLISNELATLSNELYKKSSQVFSDAKVASFYAEMSSFDGDQSDHERIMDAEYSELRKMFTECGDLYEKWFVQLNDDVSKIRAILDISGEFLE